MRDLRGIVRAQCTVAVRRSDVEGLARSNDDERCEDEEAVLFAAIVERETVERYVDQPFTAGRAVQREM
jgi:hypothetical protein